jgi:hypothetical protein
VFSRPFAETKEMRNGSGPTGDSGRSSLPPEIVSSGRPLRDDDDIQSDQLPSFVGPSRRTAIIAGAIVFMIAGLVGFWGMQAALDWWLEGRDPVPPLEVSAPAAQPPTEDLQPVSDPTPEEPVIPTLETGDPDIEAALPEGEISPETETPPEPKPKPKPEEPVRRRPVAAKKKRATKPKTRAKPKPAPVAQPAPKPAAKPEPKAEEPSRVIAPVIPPKSQPDVPPKESAPASSRAIPPSRLGILTLSSRGESKVKHRGKASGSTPASLVVRSPSGQIVLQGDDIDYAITLAYEVGADGLSVRVSSSPWSIVKHNGISLGKTPQKVSAAKRHQLTFLRPGQDEPFVVTLIWNATRS